MKRTFKPGFIVSSQAVSTAPFVHLTLTLRRGTGQESLQEKGFLSLLGTLMTRGCGKLDRSAFALDCDRRGANVQVYPSRDFFTVEVWVLPEDLSWALTTLDRMLWEPQLIGKEIEIAAEEHLLQLQARADEKKSVLWDVCREELFVPEHHYGYPLQGVEESLSTLDHDALRVFHQKFFQGSSAVLCVTGGFDPSQLESALSQRFLGADFSEHWTLSEELPYRGERRRCLGVPFPVAQSEILIALPAPRRLDPDYRMSLFVNEVFGGAFLSRLTRAVRMKEGMAYSAESRIRSGMEAGILWIGLQTELSRVKDALTVVRGCMDELLSDGLPRSEFQHFQEFVRHSSPFDYDAISDLTSRRLEEILFGEPSTLKERLEEFESCVSLDAVNSYWDAFLRPQDALVCVLGEGVTEQQGEPFFDAAQVGFRSAPLEWLSEPKLKQSRVESRLLESHGEGSLFELSNGMRLLCLPRPELASISLQVWSLTGGIDEAPGKSGLSHLLEHLMFRGTREVPDGQFDALLAQRGGLNNAFTTEDFTVYLDQVTEGGLESAFALEADRWSDLDLEEEVFRTELSVVLEERSTRVDCSPLGQAYEALQSLAFPEHPYGNPVIGRREHLEAFELQDITSHYELARDPNRMMLVVAGGCSTETAVRLAESSFPSCRQERRSLWPVEAVSQVDLLKADSTQLRERSGYSYLLLAFRFPRQGHPDYEACELLSRLLGEGDSSRLYEKYVQEEALVQEVWIRFEPQAREHPLLHIGMATPEDISNDFALNVCDFLESVAESLTQEDLEKARRVWFSEDAFSRDDLEDWALEIAGRVMLMPWDRVWEQRKRMDEVSLQDLRRVARTYLQKETCVHVLLHGESPGDELSDSAS